MRTLFVTDPPPVVEEWLARRRALGQDRFDEVWEGEYHVAPWPRGMHGRVEHELAVILAPIARAAGLVGSGGCNIGAPDDYRAPDQAYFREWQDLVYYPTAAIVVEVASPGDESRRKLDFYFRAGGEEVLIVDPDARTVEWFARGVGGFEPADRSALLGITTADLATRIDWPAA
jgi:Uma2 family endonuclease